MRRNYSTVCAECHRRKVKCSRTIPCASCIGNGRECRVRVQDEPSVPTLGAINEELQEPRQYDNEMLAGVPNDEATRTSLPPKEINEPDMRASSATSGYHSAQPFNGLLAGSNDPEWDPNARYSVEEPTIWTTMDDLVDNMLGSVHIYWQGAIWQAYDAVARSFPAAATSVPHYYTHVEPMQGVRLIWYPLLSLQPTPVYNVCPACPVCKERFEAWCCPMPEDEQ